ncbi:hypothetical protein [Rhodococcus sp. ACS1]|uniref:hypothetical protein n=1 Tax=Rhodococcus sp. ACS1 TaxID=2028570 RepID=UPI0015C95C6B|nr:hypothetical protein [Rhodococcus sp. ACS1]
MVHEPADRGEDEEIAADIETGILPDTVSAFSELHDNVDANSYAADLGSKRTNRRRGMA